MRDFLLAVSILLACLLMPVSVSANPGEGCTVQAEDLDFGRLELSTMSVYDGYRLRSIQESSIYISCGLQAQTVGVQISLISGDGNENGRRMQRVGSGFLDTLAYALYQDANYTIPWRNSEESFLNRFLEANGATTIRVYGEVFVELDSMPGEYRDTVTLQIEWF